MVKHLGLGFQIIGTLLLSVEVLVDSKRIKKLIQQSKEPFATVIQIAFWVIAGAVAYFFASIIDSAMNLSPEGIFPDIIAKFWWIWVLVIVASVIVIIMRLVPPADDIRIRATNWVFDENRPLLFARFGLFFIVLGLILSHFDW